MNTSLSRTMRTLKKAFSFRSRKPRAVQRNGWLSKNRHFFETLEDRRLLATLYVDNPGDFVITTDQGAPGLDNGDTVTWNPGAGSQHGPAVTGLTFGTNAFSTIQSAVTAATAGDTL